MQTLQFIIRMNKQVFDGKRYRNMKGLWNKALSLNNSDFETQTPGGLCAQMREPRPMTAEEIKIAKDAGLNVKDHYVG